MGWRVYLRYEDEDEFIGSFPTQEEAEIVAEHAHDEEGTYCYVLDPDSGIVFRIGEEEEGPLYEE